MKRRRQRRARQREEVEWIPQTKLGKQVFKGEITNIDQILDKGLPMKESAIVDALVKDLEEEVIPIGKAGRPFKMVQRMTDSGRRNNFLVVAAVGNKNGYLGVGEGRAKEYGPALRKAISTAKRNLMKVPRGCGSWECSCNSGHSVPFAVEGKCGSVRVVIRPAPKGIRLASNQTSRILLNLAGYSDIWTKTHGHTNSRLNLARATFDALNTLSKMKSADISRYKKQPEAKEELAKEIEEARAPSKGKEGQEQKQGPKPEPKPATKQEQKQKPEQKLEQRPEQKPESKPGLKQKLESKPEQKPEPKPEKPNKPEKPPEPKKEEAKKQDSKKQEPKKEEEDKK